MHIRLQTLLFLGTSTEYECASGCPGFSYDSYNIFIKVTQGKTYTFSWYGYADDYDAYVSYSKSINSQSYDYDLTY